VEVIQVSAQGLEDAELRRLIYDVGDIHDECMVLRPTQGATYSLSICRARRLPPFSLKEMSLLKHLGQIVLPLAAAHARLAGVANETGGTRAVDPLAACIAQRRVDLSSREAAVCSAFVQGMTADAAARALGVKPSTVETYAKRAFAKLGVNSRRELLSLVHGEARRS
jgi:LuxR family transcriptional regulator, activator of tox operons